MRIFTEAGHLTEESLILDALGDLDDTQQRRSEGHLSQCGFCRDQHKAVAISIVLLKSQAQRSCHRK
jgi:xanthine dehydrogenase iron-sulfur cluster and FAD-binding subunit A